MSPREAHAARTRNPLRALSRTRRVAVVLCLGLATAAAAQPYLNVRVDVATPYPEETAIAINPLDVNEVAAVAQGSGCYFYSSTDRGETWSEGQLLSQHDLGDPAIAFDRARNCYFCYIGTYSHSGIFVNHSTDGGRTWPETATPVIEHSSGTPFEDKSYPACDPGDGPYAGNVYVAWTQFDQLGSADPADSTRILFSRSTDRGATFSAPARLSDRGGDALDDDSTVEGAVPAVGPDGTVYVAWSGPRGIEFDRSSNGGVTWGADRVISDQPGGWNISIPGLYRANGFPVVKVDRSAGPWRGRVYVLWSDQRNGDTDVFLLFSDDGGASWGPRVRVNNDALGNGAHQFFPWIDVDPVTGIVAVVYYDRREQPATEWTDVYVGRSTDGGSHFTDEKISSSPFDPNPLVFFGDYIGIAAYAGWVRPFWMRLENNQLSVWTALIDPGPGDVPSPPGIFVLRVVPNPVRTRATISLRNLTGTPSAPPPALLRLEIADAAGRVVRTLLPAAGFLARESIEWDGRDASGRALASGVYFVSAGERARGRLVLIR